MNKIKRLIMDCVALFAPPLATMLLWNWFVAPITYFQTLNYFEAFGLLLLVSLLRGGIRRAILEERDKKKYTLTNKEFLLGLLTLAALVLFGWLITLFL